MPERISEQQALELVIYLLVLQQYSNSAKECQEAHKSAKANR